MNFAGIEESSQCLDLKYGLDDHRADGLVGSHVVRKTYRGRCSSTYCREENARTLQILLDANKPGYEYQAGKDHAEWVQVYHDHPDVFGTGNVLWKQVKGTNGTLYKLPSRRYCNLMLQYTEQDLCDREEQIGDLQSLFFFLERYERPRWRGVVKTHFNELKAHHDVLLVIQSSIENLRVKLLEERHR